MIVTRDLRSERARDSAPEQVALECIAETEEDRDRLRALLELEPEELAFALAQVLRAREPIIGV